ncbi:hypothetical protein BDW22DRAFT_1347526 [Trametopsis cervina]|nr:hypothetical protein BDW22DRAFT_1347526 [Trametopsis cervina]
MYMRQKTVRAMRRGARGEGGKGGCGQAAAQVSRQGHAERAGKGRRATRATCEAREQRAARADVDEQQGARGEGGRGKGEQEPHVLRADDGTRRGAVVHAQASPATKSRGGREREAGRRAEGLRMVVNENGEGTGSSVVWQLGCKHGGAMGKEGKGDGGYRDKQQRQAIQHGITLTLGCGGESALTYTTHLGNRSSNTVPRGDCSAAWWARVTIW